MTFRVPKGFECTYASALVFGEGGLVCTACAVQRETSLLSGSLCFVALYAEVFVRSVPKDLDAQPKAVEVRVLLASS